MSFLGACARGVRRLWRGDAGAIAIEAALALPLVVAVATATGDFRESARASSALEAAVQDAARVLSLTPVDEATGTLSPDGVAMAFEVFSRRLAEAGVEIGLLRPDLGDAVCAAGGSPCYRIDVVEGSEEMFGAPRYAVTVAAAATLETPLLALLRSDVAVADDGAVSVTSAASRMIAP